MRQYRNRWTFFALELVLLLIPSIGLLFAITGLSGSWVGFSTKNGIREAKRVELLCMLLVSLAIFLVILFFVMVWVRYRIETDEAGVRKFNYLGEVVSESKWGDLTEAETRISTFAGLNTFVLNSPSGPLTFYASHGNLRDLLAGIRSHAPQIDFAAWEKLFAA